MRKKLDLFWVVIIFLCGIVLGVNWENYEGGMHYFWRDGNGGMKQFVDALKKDNTERLGMALITEKGVYRICSLKDYDIYATLGRK